MKLLPVEENIREIKNKQQQEKEELEKEEKRKYQKIALPWV